MKMKITILILLFSISCNKAVENKKDDIITKPEKWNDEIVQQIGEIYQPESLKTKEIKPFKIEIHNSDTIDNEIKNIEIHAKNIAELFKLHLENNKIKTDTVEVNIFSKKHSTTAFIFPTNQLKFSKK